VYPVAAVLASKEIMLTIRPGEHGSTYGGNPLACAVASASLKVLVDERLTERAQDLGVVFRSTISGWKHPLVQTVRGRGLLNAVVINEGASTKRRTAWQLCLLLKSRGVLAKPTHGHMCVLRLVFFSTISLTQLTVFGLPLRSSSPTRSCVAHSTSSRRRLMTSTRCVQLRRLLDNNSSNFHSSMSSPARLRARRVMRSTSRTETGLDIRSQNPQLVSCSSRTRVLYIRILHNVSNGIMPVSFVTCGDVNGDAARAVGAWQQFWAGYIAAWPATLRLLLIRFPAYAPCRITRSPGGLDATVAQEQDVNLR